jgi:signal peptidase I
MRHRSVRFVATLLILEALLGLWIFFAPTQMGGSSVYSVTSGVSMQPLLVRNDLALVRVQTSYHVGDVVLYHSAILDKPVLHRIIAIQNGDYFFKGDNNNFVDPGYATRSQLVGKLWIHVPAAGAVIGWLGVPFHAALLAGVATLVVLLSGGTRIRKKRRRGHIVSAIPTTRPTYAEGGVMSENGG